MYRNKHSDQVWRKIFSYCLVLFFLALQTSFIYAQKRVEVEREDLPEEVAEGIEKNYLPCKEKIKWYVTDRNASVDYYVATATGDRISCESVYDKNGKLIRAKTVLTDIKLPSHVAKAVRDEYPEWKVSNGHFVFRDFDMDKKHFEVVIARDGKEQTPYYDDMGKRMELGEIGRRKYTEIQRNRVPKTVAESIEGDFLPCKEGPKWYVEDEQAQVDEYVVRTTGQNLNCEAVYDRKGRLIRSETVMSNIKLPRPVMERVSANFPRWKITQDKMVMENFDKQKAIYEVSIDRDGKTMKVYYDANGKRVMPTDV